MTPAAPHPLLAPAAPVTPATPYEQGWVSNANIPGIVVRTNRDRHYGTLDMNNYLGSLGGIGGGGWHVGDLSSHGGGRLGGHRSHQSGIDADIGIPTVDNNHSISRDGDRWGFTSARQNIDYNRTLEFLKHTAPRAKFVFLDRRFHPELQRLAREQVKSGGMAQEQYDQIFKVVRHEPGHHNHFHVRLNTPGVADPRSTGRYHSQHAHE